MTKKNKYYPVNRHGPVTVISLTGEIDMQTSPNAREQMLDILKKKGSLLVDLSKTQYIDSSGVASLVEGLQLAKSRKLSFALVEVSHSVKQVLQLARLDKVFPIHQTLEQALTAMGIQEQG